MASDFSWTCPYCNQVATITPENVSEDRHQFNNGNKLDTLRLYTKVIVCPNSKCKEFTIQANLYTVHRAAGNEYVGGQPILSWSLKPQSSAKPFPEYIPAPIRQDYEEACRICDLSPKASATLSRRCLQGIIRDFWGISRGRLIDEILELKPKIDGTTWEAIDAVRNIGNIGAHMEKDINFIVDVEPNEAELLVRLIEVLLQEWYIHRYERQQHMQKVITTAQAKTAAKSKPAT
jgi:hypothetical protein